VEQGTKMRKQYGGWPFRSANKKALGKKPLTRGLGKKMEKNELEMWEGHTSSSKETSLQWGAYRRFYLRGIKQDRFLEEVGGDVGRAGRAW